MRLAVGHRLSVFLRQANVRLRVALSGLGRSGVGRTQGVALGWVGVPRWGREQFRVSRFCECERRRVKFGKRHTARGGTGVGALGVGGNEEHHSCRNHEWWHGGRVDLEFFRPTTSKKPSTPQHRATAPSAALVTQLPRSNPRCGARTIVFPEEAGEGI